MLKNIYNNLLLFPTLAIALSGIFLFSTSVEAANLGDVVINEIAWMGGESTADEWIELKNNSSNVIDLTGWALTAADGTPNISLIGIIEPNGYFLLERTDDDTVPGITADQTYSGALDNTGENLTLLDTESDIIDEIICDDAWSAGNNGTKQTMERSSNLDWQTSSEANGTPKAPNSEGVTEDPEPSPTDTDNDGIIDEEDNCPLIPNPEQADDDQDGVGNNCDPDQTDLPDSPWSDGASPDYSNKVVINEIFPDPEDESQEWIELKNISTTTIDLLDWYIADAIGKTYIISTTTASSTEILSSGFYLLPKQTTGIALNNSGDIVNLYQPDDNLLQSIEYDETFENWSYARDEDGSWSWTTIPTQSQDNQFNLPEPENNSSGGGSSSSSSSNSVSGINYSKEIIITELLPNPIGSDSAEWIEFYNQGNQDINLQNWQIGDNSSRKYTICPDDFETTTIKTRSYFLVPRSASSIALNNTGGDIVKLYQPNGELLFEVEYSQKAEDGYSYALLNNVWHWTTTPTPASQNIITEENELPIAAFEIDGSLVNTPITFDASESYDPEGEDLVYHWQFGSNTTTPTTTPIITHIFIANGKYNIKLTVEDTEGQVTTIEKGLIVVTDTDLADFAYSADIIITEIMPNPAGSDTELEWIEIFNRGSSPVNLVNWQIDDIEGGSRPYTISDEIIIEPGQYLVFDRPLTGIAFNNSYDLARLFNPIGEAVDEVNYDEVIEDASYSMAADNTWYWTFALTPGNTNIVDQMTENTPYDKSTGQAKSQKTQKHSAFPVLIELENVRSFDFGDMVTAEGIVAVEPGTLGKNIFYIVDPNASTGIQIYCYSKDFPLLGIGDIVAITGSLSESRTETRLKIKTRDDITILSPGQEFPLSATVQIEDIDENLEGALIQIEGELTEINGSSWWLDDSTEEVKIYIKQSTQIKKGDIAVGDTLNITGIVSEWDEEYRILPRWPEDIVVVKKVLGASDIKTQNPISKNQEGNNNIFKYLFVVACGVIIILLNIIFRQRIKFKKPS